MKNIIFLLLSLLGVLSSWAIDTGQKIFKTNVQTLSVSNPDNFMSPPVLRIGSHDRININFDLIGDQHEYLKYRLIHCNADWQPSRLLESEYLGGFNEVAIEDFAYSANTYIHYINYNISLPDPQLPILASGNYFLQVFPENDPDDIWLQARFSVSEELTPIRGGMTTKTDKGVNSDFQQLFFSVEGSNLSNINPYQDLIVVITQNNRPETTRVISHPLRVQGNNIIFEHSPELLFEAGNEYRRFETVRTDYPGMHVEAVDFNNNIWNAYLLPDQARKHREYSYDNTQHGRFKVDEYNSSEPDLAADYVMVHFSLDPGERQYGEIYVDGDFTNHQFSQSNLMKYNWEDGLYHTSIPLKQGSYNYQYVTIPTNGGIPSPAHIEGNKYETNNEYLIQIFLDAPGTRANRLVGTSLIN